ncbi:MAG: CehA/McbA family metallohydrolase [Candidatus Zipacnadales bacterium]
MRIAFPYRNDGQWYRGNLHCHTTYSDGGHTPAEVVEFYRAAGYDFLALTDHGILTPWKEHCTKQFLCLAGEELSTPHMVAVGLKLEVEDTLDFGGQIAAIRTQGALPILAHPAWMGLRVAEIAQHDGLLGIEIYNYICETLNGKGYSLNIWDELLDRGHRLWGFAVDDAHMSEKHPGALKGWIVARAPRLTVRSILQALVRGCFYASTGPTIEAVELNGEELYIRCSPCDSIIFVGAAYYGKCFRAPDGGKITEATCRLSIPWKYCRVECRAGSTTAWTNPVFVSPE